MKRAAPLEPQQVDLRSDQSNIPPVENVSVDSGTIRNRDRSRRIRLGIVSPQCTWMPMLWPHRPEDLAQMQLQEPSGFDEAPRQRGVLVRTIVIENIVHGVK